MNNRTNSIAVLIAMLGLSLVLTGAESGGAKGSVQVTLSVFPSAMVITGKTVVISIDEKELAKLQAASKTSDLPLHFRWRKNGQAIPGATKSTYTLANVSIADAASYTLLLTGSTEAETAPVHLSVYFHHSTNSNGGTMRTPIGDFINQNNTICGATGWTKYKVYLPFDGPFKTPPVSVDYPNTSNGSKLTFDTCSVDNGSIDTAVRVRENFGLMTELCCNNDTNCGLSNATLSKCASVSLQTDKNYRVTIYLKNVGTQPNVTFNWLYDN